MIDLVFKNNTSDTKLGRIFFHEILETAADILELEGKMEVSVNLVAPAQMKLLNSRHRGKDKVTDVLSFPLQEQSLKKYGIMPLGDIFICPSFSNKEAIKEKKDANEHMAHLAVHGFLHLLGYEHEKSQEEARKMEQVEKKILKNINF
jgi:probable rRNA maturation factor